MVGAIYYQRFKTRSSRSDDATRCAYGAWFSHGNGYFGIVYAVFNNNVALAVFNGIAGYAAYVRAAAAYRTFYGYVFNESAALQLTCEQAVNASCAYNGSLYGKVFNGCAFQNSEHTEVIVALERHIAYGFAVAVEHTRERFGPATYLSERAA